MTSWYGNNDYFGGVPLKPALGNGMIGGGDGAKDKIGRPKRRMYTGYAGAPLNAADAGFAGTMGMGRVNKGWGEEIDDDSDDEVEYLYEDEDYMKRYGMRFDENRHVRRSRYSLEHVMHEDLVMEQQLLVEGWWENMATSVFGAIPVAGDAAAIAKSVIDFGRYVKSVVNMYDVLYEVGAVTSEEDLTDANMIKTKEKIKTMSPSAKEKILKSLMEVSEAVKRLIISLISISPDQVVSGSIAAFISNVPVIKLVMSGQSFITSLIDKLSQYEIFGYRADVILKKMIRVGAALVSGGTDLIMTLIGMDMLTLFTTIGSLYEAVSSRPPGRQFMSDIGDTAIAGGSHYAGIPTPGTTQDFSAIEDVELEGDGLPPIAESLLKRYISEILTEEIEKDKKEDIDEFSGVANIAGYTGPLEAPTKKERQQMLKVAHGSFGGG